MFDKILNIDTARERYPTNAPCMVLNKHTHHVLWGKITGLRPNCCPIVEVDVGGVKTPLYFRENWTSSGGVYELLAVYRN